MASSYIVKPFSERSYNIVFQRNTVGEIRKLNDLWNAAVKGSDGRRHSVRGYVKHGDAFHNVMLVMKFENLKTRVPNFDFDFSELLQGTGDAAADVMRYNRYLAKFVDLFNANSQNQLYVSTPRRRR